MMMARSLKVATMKKSKVLYHLQALLCRIYRFIQATPNLANRRLINAFRIILTTTALGTALSPAVR